jgi:hypothetical protein
VADWIDGVVDFLCGLCAGCVSPANPEGIQSKPPSCKFCSFCLPRLAAELLCRASQVPGGSFGARCLLSPPASGRGLRADAGFTYRSRSRRRRGCKKI